MCGIAGAISLGNEPLDALKLKAMADIISHRGPDDAGYLVWQSGKLHPLGVAYGQAFTESKFQPFSPLLPCIDTDAGRQLLTTEKWDLMMAHRRLSIIDLTSRGHQPMTVRDNSLWVSFNGEIYNYRELRAELEKRGHNFLSHCDTEVILHGYTEWGADCVKRFNGMFAFALWDNRAKKMILARDRYGIKPLYYHYSPVCLVFGSEIKSILKYLPVRPGVDLYALDEYMSFQNTLSNRTLFSGIRIFEPGQIMEIDRMSGKISTRRFWDFDFTRQLTLPHDEVCEELNQRIQTAVRRQCVSDVPIGCFLSGGLDSSTMAALTSGQLGRINTFTGGFDLSEAAAHEMNYDERKAAEYIASRLQTEHYEVVIHSGDISACLDNLVWHLEDLRVGQCYPNWYVSRLAGKFVKVVMSGIGGDELFGGYPWRYAAAIGPKHEDYIRNYYSYWKRLVRNRNKPRLFNADTLAQMSELEEHGEKLCGDYTFGCFKRVFGSQVNAQTIEEQANWSLYFECKTFLHGLLVVEDKLSMAHSLESRVPMLDNDLVDYASVIPIRYKVPGLEEVKGLDENDLQQKNLYKVHFQSGKSILRMAMEKILPKEITSLRKQGFSAPDESWFRGSAERWVREMLLQPSSRVREFFNPPYLQEVVDKHISGEDCNRLLIWSLVCLEQWMRKFQ